MSRAVLLFALALGLACADQSVDGGDPLPFGQPDGGQADAEDGPDGGKPDDISPNPVECAPGFDVVDGECELDTTSRWDVRILDGSFTARQPSGGKWDLNGSAPDGYVSIVFGPAGLEIETEVDGETYEPEWNESALWSVSVTELRTHFDLSLYDYDAYDVIDGDDLMASCLMAFPDEVFTAEIFDASDIDTQCPSVRMSLHLAH